jgi:integrase
MKFTGRPGTIKTKESMHRNWVVPYLADDGSNLDDAIETWEADLQPATVKALLYIAKEHVKEESGVDLDIKAHVTRIGRSKQQLPPKGLTRSEIVALSAVIKEDDPLYLPFHIGINSGMRRGEVFGLMWEDIDLLKGQITVSRSYNGPTKSGKSRIVPISPALEKILLAIVLNKSYNCSKRQRTGLVLKSTFDPNPPLKRACKEAGVKQITYHGLRHSFATLALDAGRSPVLVSRVLGHSSVVTTLSVYWNISSEKLDLSFLDE